MKNFLDEDFLLSNDVAKKLYHEHAEKMPIIDYHCHLSPKEIYEDKKFVNLTEAWLGPGDRTGDHYKWRALRMRGYLEDTISGKCDDKLKFDQFAESMPYFVGNPLYHWSHLELRRYFGIYEIINKKNADIIWEKANKMLETLTARQMIYKMNVEVVCTTDDPIDSLEYHKLLKDDKTLKVKVLPTFRPDKAMQIENPTYLNYLASLEKVVDFKIDNLEKLVDALKLRVNYFASVGAKLADHGLDTFYYEDATYEQANSAFLKVLNKEQLTEKELGMFKGYVLVELGKEYSKLNWTQQYHIGALRNNSKRNFEALGPDTGFDGMNDRTYISQLSKLLSKQDETDQLPKTILYCLNPRDVYALSVLAGCFQKEGVKGRVLAGTAWWFLDQQDGMRQNFETQMQVSVLSQSVGMLTDSRSFLAYPRHEYYRRILCDMFGRLVENGEYPIDELDTLGEIVEDICYNNAKNYFKF